VPSKLVTKSFFQEVSLIPPESNKSLKDVELLGTVGEGHLLVASEHWLGELLPGDTSSS
jgi:hypothetical protein